MEKTFTKLYCKYVSLQFLEYAISSLVRTMCGLGCALSQSKKQNFCSNIIQYARPTYK